MLRIFCRNLFPGSLDIREAILLWHGYGFCRAFGRNKTSRRPCRREYEHPTLSHGSSFPRSLGIHCQVVNSYMGLGGVLWLCEPATPPVITSTFCLVNSC